MTLIEVKRLTLFLASNGQTVSSFMALQNLVNEIRASFEYTIDYFKWGDLEFNAAVVFKPATNKFEVVRYEVRKVSTKVKYSSHGFAYVDKKAEDEVDSHRLRYTDLGGIKGIYKARTFPKIGEGKYDKSLNSTYLVKH